MIGNGVFAVASQSFIWASFHTSKHSRRPPLSRLHGNFRSLHHISEVKGEASPRTADRVMRRPEPGQSSQSSSASGSAPELRRFRWPELGGPEACLLPHDLRSLSDLQPGGASAVMESSAGGKDQRSAVFRRIFDDLLFRFIYLPSLQVRAADYDPSTIH